MTTRGSNIDYNRISKRMEEAQTAIVERMEVLFDGIGKRLDRLERDAASGEQDRGYLKTEIDELRRDQGELREIVRNELITRGDRSVKEAARGAAEGPTRSTSVLIGVIMAAATAVFSLAGWMPKALEFIVKMATVQSGAPPGDAP